MINIKTLLQELLRHKWQQQQEHEHAEGCHNHHYDITKVIHERAVFLKQPYVFEDPISGLFGDDFEIRHIIERLQAEDQVEGEVDFH